MAYNPQNPNGQASSANSSPVVLSTEQQAILEAITTPSDTQPVSGTVTANAGSGTMNVSIQNTSVPVTGTFYQATQPVSASTLPLPTGAATSAKQPALGTAGTASTDVLTVQGIASMTALKVDGSAVTQPVSGTITANAGTNLNTSALALESGGNLAAINTKTPSLGQATMANSAPVVISSDQSTLNVTTSNLPALVTEVPAPNASSSVTRVVGQDIVVAGFSSVGSSVLDAAFVQTPIVGTGVTYNQGSGSLNILAGTTINAEFLARSVATFKGSVRLKYGIIASQRVANNNLMIALADLIGEGLAYNIVSATLVDVTLNAHGFTSANVGQFMNIAGITGAAGVPSRYAIQSIPNANTIRFTVAGFPASGTGTCTLFGWNQIRNLYNGATATAVAFDSQRNGWAAGDTTATINTTASPGTIVSNESTGKDVFLMDALRASSTSAGFISRASRYENMPDPNTTLYVFIWSYNGTVAPTATTFTLSSLSVEEFSNLPVYVQGVRSNGAQNALPVTINSGTVTSVTTVGTVTSGNLGLPSLIADVTSAAIAATAQTAALTPTFGCSYQVFINVSAVSGTTPTMDVDIEESDDTGTTWFKVYSFPRITATGVFRSPKLRLRGNRIRYNQTVGGTSPSFTRLTNRLQSSDSPNNSISQIFDRSIVLTTLNSVTTSLNAQNGQIAQLQVNIGTTTIAPILQLEGSDDNGSTWYSIGAPLTAVASSTVSLTVANTNAQLLRARVSTAGTSTIAGYVLIKAL